MPESDEHFKWNEVININYFMIRISKGYQTIVEGHKYADTRRQLSSFMLLFAERTKPMKDAEYWAYWKIIPFIDK